MPEPGPTRTAAGPSGRASVLRAVSVDRTLSVPPGHQLERQLAVMVRDGRVEPGRRLPSTRRLAPVIGLHRNTVAAAYRRLAGRGLVELRHGARARVSPVVAGPAGGGVARVAAAAADSGTARLMAAEIRDAVAPNVEVEPLVVDRATRLGPGDGAAEGRLVAALPGPALRRIARAPGIGGAGQALRVMQDRRERAREALLRAPALAVVAVATGCPPLREAVESDAGRVRGRELSLRTAAGRSLRPATGAGGPVPAVDLVIADRLATDAFCGRGPSPSDPDVVRARLLCPESLAAIAGGAGGTGDAPVRDRDP